MADREGAGSRLMHSTVAAFLGHLRTERNASAHTLRSYEDDLTLFCAYLEEAIGEGADPTAADSQRLRRYSAWLHGRGYAASTIARRLASLRSFYRYQRRQGVVTSDPAGGLRNPRQPKRLPHPFRVEDVIRLLDAISPDTPLGVRDRAMFETLYGGGLRVGELVGLNLDDLDAEQELVRVRGKGKRERLCPLGGVAVAWISRWIAVADAGACRRAGTLPESVRPAADGAERRQAAGGARQGRRPRREPEPPLPPAQLRHAPARPRGRPEERPGIARASEPDHHPDLHPRDPGAVDQCLPRSAPACLTPGDRRDPMPAIGPRFGTSTFDDIASAS